MKNLKKRVMLLMLVIPLITLTSCSNDDDTIFVPEILESKTYALGTLDVSGISGTAKFINNGNGTTTIELDIQGTPTGGMHPAHIHANTAAENGVIVLDLGPVDGSTGKSSITISELNDETPISYLDLLTFDGYINVHLSAAELGTVVAQGDIGQNELTGESITYALDELNASGVSGEITFSERINGETLAVFDMTGTVDGVRHPAHIHFNSAAEGGAIAYTFKNEINPDEFGVDGTTGTGKYNISNLDGETSAFTYDMLINYDGYINVHESMDNLANVVAQGNIGSNI